MLNFYSDAVTVTSFPPGLCHHSTVLPTPHYSTLHNAPHFKLFHTPDYSLFHTAPTLHNAPHSRLLPTPDYDLCVNSRTGRYSAGQAGTGKMSARLLYCHLISYWCCLLALKFMN